jgi:hypothetical protein
MAFLMSRSSLRHALLACCGLCAGAVVWIWSRSNTACLCIENRNAHQINIALSTHGEVRIRSPIPETVPAMSEVCVLGERVSNSERDAIALRTSGTAIVVGLLPYWGESPQVVVENGRVQHTPRMTLLPRPFCE